MSGKYNREARKASAGRLRAEVASYKVDAGCIDCGYNANAYALEFDHLPGTDKLGTVASMMYRSRKAVWEEIEKCEVVCANCHAIRTMTRMQQ
jgi:hypothetical protein